MAKDTFYFSHDYNARNDPKILELRSEFGMEGYGIYWCIIETLAEDENSRAMTTLMGGLSVGYGIPKDRLMQIVEFMLKIGLLHQDESGYYSQRMNDHKEGRKLLSDKGKAGANKRWKNSHPNSPPNAKERKGKERKELNVPFNSDEFILTWELLKKEPKWKNKSENALRLSLNNLAKHAEPVALKMMENAIANNWQGLFELDNKQQSAPYSPSPHQPAPR